MRIRDPGVHGDEFFAGDGNDSDGVSPAIHPAAALAAVAAELNATKRRSPFLNQL